MTIFPGTSVDDTFIISAANNGDQYDGGTGNDTVQLAQPPLILTNPFGSWWFYNFTGITFTSIEKLDFSAATGQTNQVHFFTSQFGPGLLNNFQINGGVGADKLYIFASVAGTYTMPAITKTNWTTDTSIAGLQNLTDIVALIGSGSANYTLNATNIHTGIEALVGGSGNDTLNGGSSQDFLAGSAGTDILNAGGGDDFLGAGNQIGQFNTFASSTFNGGTGVDTLVISGDVDFQGTVTSIEHLRLNPAVAAGPGSTGFNNAALTITESVADQFFPTLTLIEGFGDIEYTMESNVYDASAIQIAAGSQIEFDVFGTLLGDTMTGSAADEVFFGDDGDDVMFGGAGNDGLVGDNGNDTMTGGAGNDVFAVSFGHDVVTDFTVGQDQIAVPDVIANFDMLKPYMSQVGNDTVLSFTYGGTQHTLTLQNVSLAALSSASLFATDYNSGDPGTAFDDFLFGSDLNFSDVIDGQGGNDIIFAGSVGSDQVTGGAGNDTIVVTATQSVFNGSTVTFPYLNSTLDGGTGTDTLRASAFGTANVSAGINRGVNFSGNTISGFENLEFQANAGDRLQLQFTLSQFTGNFSTVTGSAGSDIITLIAPSAGDFTIPTITLNNWSLDLSPVSSSSTVLNSDSVFLVAGGSSGSTLHAHANHSGLEGLIGSIGNDILLGGNDSDYLLAGGNGADQLSGGGGMDILEVSQQSSQGTYSDDVYDGGVGTDYLKVVGNVTFAGTLTSMEGIWLTPAPIAAPGIPLPPFGNAQLTIDAAHAAAFGANALLRGAGSVIVNATTAGMIDLSGWQFETNPITVAINGSTGNDIIKGTSKDDMISGGLGIDTAVFSGNRSNYSISSNGNGKYTVTDNRLGSPNGIDTLSSIERLQFADVSVRMPTGRDFNTDQVGDILFRNTSGLFATWQLSGQGSLFGGGNIGNPGSTNRLVGMGDFDGDGRTDLLFRDRGGVLASWQISGTSITGGGLIGNPGAAFALMGTGDFNGDGKSDLLFLNSLTGAYASWDINGRSIVGGGTIGTPGPSWIYKATADFNGDGKSDILFQNVNGSYAVWTLNDTAIAGGGTVGNPGASWFFKGTGDFNGDGKSDILFQKYDGTYATWDLNGTTIVGGGTLGNPGAAWTLAGIGDYNGDGKSDLLFRNANGSLKTWNLNDTITIGSHTPGNPGSSFSVANGHNGNDFAALVFQNSSNSTVASWIVNGKTLVGGGTLGTPGSAWTAKAVGDFAGTGEKDILFQKTDGTLAIWQSNGVNQVGGGTIGNPGSAWTLKGVGDFNGDGKSDILFQNNISNQFATWNISGTTIIGGASIGSAAGYNFMDTGDLNGDGKSDILFQDASGKYAAWFMDDTRIIGGGAVGNPGAAWTFEALADFNADGKADILFKNTNGTYATWDLDGTSIVGGGTIGNPGGTWSFAKATDLNGDSKADIVFHDATGNYASWLIDDTRIIGGSNLGSVNNQWHIL